jgi:hypothetical protein
MRVQTIMASLAHGKPPRCGVSTRSTPRNNRILATVSGDIAAAILAAPAERSEHPCHILVARVLLLVVIVSAGQVGSSVGPRPCVPY